jgi:phenylpropionate dioxygenase-like ring-hydroxylating dioxygenase large terminal subunit
MPFLRSAWYCVGFPGQLTDGAVQTITVLGEPLVLFRDAAGRFAALQDRCPHRFAPLSSGSLIDGQLQCGYHGLRFDAQGRCVLNPHGDGRIPGAATVRGYATLERHGALWVWMGEAGQADPARLPDFSMVDERPGWTRVHDRLHVRAHYQLVIDNLLDLSHVQYLHPFLADPALPPPGFTSRIELRQDGDTVTAINEMNSIRTNALFAMLWERGEPPALCDMRANMHWHPPSLLYLDTGATHVGADKSEGPTTEFAHWLTPETASTTHYFWVGTRDRHVGDEAVSAQVRAGVDGAFRMEDEPMIERLQRQMDGRDLFDMQPVMLQTDGPAVRARRVLMKCIADEAAARA